MTTRLSTQGQIVIPQDIREHEHLEPGDDFQISTPAPGQILLRKIPRDTARRVRLVKRKNKLPAFDVPKDAPALSLETVNRLRNE